MAVALGALLLTACGGGGSTSTSASTVSSYTGPFNWKAAQGQTINVLFNEHPYANAIIKRLPEFQKETGITVKYQVIPESSYFTKLSLDLGAKNGNIDAFMTGTYQLWGYATAGYMEPLDDLIKSSSWTSPDYDVQDFIPNVLNGDRWDLKPGSPVGTGPLWAIPMGFEQYPITYNVKAFQKAGITKLPTTLPELVDVAKKLNGWNGPGSYGIAVRGSRNWGTIHPDYMSLFSNYGAKDFTIQNGRLVTGVNSPQAVEMTQLWIDMVRHGAEPGWANYDWYQNGADLGAGKAAMMYDADILGFFTNQPGGSKEAGNLRWMMPPKGPDGQLGSNEWIWSIAMNKYSTHKLATWLFMQWFTSKQHDLWGATNGYLMDPPRQSVWNDPKFVDYVNKAAPGYLEVFKQLNPHTKIEFTPEPEFFNVATQWATKLQEIESGSVDVKTGMDQLADQINQMVADIKVTGQ